MSCRRPRPRLDIQAQRDVDTGQWVIRARSGRGLLRPGRHLRAGPRDGWGTAPDPSF